jgi:hypothetical protein
MASLEYFRVRLIAGEASQTPPDNDNLELMPGCPLTPAELMQWARRERKRLSRELATDASLWACPKHRRTWDETLAIEKLTLWHCYGVWDA